MKEATGELSSSLIAVICIAILIAFFYFEIWPIFKTNFNAETACDKAVCEPNVDKETGLVNCSLDGQIFQCKFKG